MKIVAAETGWAASRQSLFWTTNDGAQWTDTTPRLAHKSQTILSVAFLDSSNGWVLMSCADRRNRNADDTCFEFANTNDSGKSWAIMHPKVVDPDPESGFSGAADLSFFDTLHGWAILKVNRSTAVSFGVTPRTEDGGKTWSSIQQPPIAESPRFTSANVGWLAGGPNHELYVSRNAGNSWETVSLPEPSGIGMTHGTDYDLPTFTNREHGFLPVRYEVGPEIGPDLSTLVLDSTRDEGRTWKQTAVLPKLPIAMLLEWYSPVSWPRVL
jgi:photosystem II stability/assembly factor-like uncharacterized protein